MKRWRRGKLGREICSMERSVWFPGVVALTAILGVSLSSAPASADTVYDWSMSGGLSGSGTITLSSTPTVTPDGTGYLATAMTGSLTSADFSTTVTGLFETLAVNNIVYYPTEQNGFVLDDFGLGVTLFNNYEIEIGAANGNPGKYNVSCCGGGEPIYDYELVTFSLGSAVATPEPSTWLMMIAGLPLVGFLGVRRSRRSSALAAAR
jgi:PEP-CTERM motif